MIVCLFLYWIIEECLGNRYKYSYKRLLFVSVILSPFILDGALERGNTAILAMMCILLAVNLKDSDNKIKRELAMVLIAIAAGLKIYPAVFGLLYIKEKRWKDVFRLIAYGVMIFFVPFLFTGGIGGLLAYIKVLIGFSRSYSFRWTSIKNYLYALACVLKIDSLITPPILALVEVAYLAVLITAFFKTSDNWKSVLYLSVLLATFVSNSYRYVAVYMTIPLVYYFMLDDSDKQGKYKYLIIFSIMFSVPWYGYLINLNADFCIFTSVYLCVVVSLIEDFIKIKRCK
jgi:hypothetical protein